jgi:hypothetical protein
MKFYSEDTTSNLFQSKNLEIKHRVESESENYILNVGEEQYIEYLKKDFEIGFPVIHEDQVSADSYETEIAGSRYPPEFGILDRSKPIKTSIIAYHVPYSGNINILRFRPDTFFLSGGADFPVDQQTQTIKIEIINFYNDSVRIKQAYEECVGSLISSYNILKAEIEQYNNRLPEQIRSTYRLRRQKILERQSLLSSLGVPIRKSQSTPETFSVPKPLLRKKIVVKPEVREHGFTPEPTLSNEDYFQILKIINDVGKNFERQPSVYTDKGEEDLRDHVLFTLDPNFEYGSASGETFNKSGKTDILLRYDSSVVFVAECKFWDGEKQYLETIDQLLGYLTWRDSKTSVVIFVRNKEMSSVVEKAREATKNHPNFISQLADSDASWLNYIFSLPNNSNKEIKLAVQLFHIPPVDK